MCNHDIYGGGDQPDPNNPNTTPDGKPRTVNGLFATKAAIAYAKAHYPTGKVFLHGGSAGSAGRLQRGLGHAGGGRAAGRRDRRLGQRQPPVGGGAGAAGHLRRRRARHRRDRRAAPSRARPATKNQPDLLIARGDLTVPILHTWSRADPNVCGDTPMTCTLADGSTTTMGSADCSHELDPPRHRGARGRQQVAQPAPLREPRRRARAAAPRTWSRTRTAPNTDPGRARGLQRRDHGLGALAPGRPVGLGCETPNLRAILGVRDEWPNRGND